MTTTSLAWGRVRMAAAVLTVALTAIASAAADAGRDGAAQTAALAPRLTLERLVAPTTTIVVQARIVRFALHGLILFDTLDALFRAIDREAGRWHFDSAAARQAFADALLARGVESRLVSMETELPLEVLLTHTESELAGAVSAVAPGSATIFAGQHWQLSRATYLEAFRRVRHRWSTSLNCWSASSSLPGRVLSNWYIIDEGITLYGAVYDSTEHFWQAVKYHPEVTVGEVRTLLAEAAAIDWPAWIDTLANDQRFYFANGYAVEFMRRNLGRERLTWYRDELARVATDGTRARTAQQREGRPAGLPPRFLAVDEKVLWGDVADLFHLVVAFTATPERPVPTAIAALRRSLLARHFDAIHLAGYGSGRVGFLSPEFQALMLEIWKVKFVQMPRFAAVIRSTAGTRLDHFLNDGDSPDIPIPIYVGHLNRIRELALETRP